MTNPESTTMTSQTTLTDGINRELRLAGLPEFDPKTRSPGFWVNACDDDPCLVEVGWFASGALLDELEYLMETHDEAQTIEESDVALHTRMGHLGLINCEMGKVIQRILRSTGFEAHMSIDDYQIGRVEIYDCAHEDPVATKWAAYQEMSGPHINHPLIDAAFAQPQLRNLYPYTSFRSLYFSRCTGYPFSRDVPFIERSWDGDYRVIAAKQMKHPWDLLGVAADAAQAVELVVAHLPTGCGSAVVGGPEKLT